MSKAIQILKEPLVALPKDGGGFIFSYEAKDIQNVISIIEEAMTPKTCDGCKWNFFKDCTSLPCSACIRNVDTDYYEPKGDA